MAKTLIGNIKGKNGRGITSIKKTGTDGSIDTYTITYTDSTTSTFTVNNSDSISLQRQIVPSAAVESSTTASQAYTAGDYVVVGGVLRKVKSSIAKGSTISDSNSTATTVTEEIETVRDSVSQNGIWTIFTFGKFCICTARYQCPNNVDIQKNWGNLLESQDIKLPDYPVAFASKPWLNLLVSDCSGEKYMIASIEFSYKDQSPTSPGSVNLLRPSGSPATISRPVFSIAAIGVLP